MSEVKPLKKDMQIPKSNLEWYKDRILKKYKNANIVAINFMLDGISFVVILN